MIYLVFDKKFPAPLAAFTDKRESQEWAEARGIESLERYQMKDGNCPPRRGPVDCPWEEPCGPKI